VLVGFEGLALLAGEASWHQARIAGYSFEGE
jgi:hypothetical protein